MDAEPRTRLAPRAPRTQAPADRRVWDIRPGEAVARADVHERFGGNPRTRIAPSRATANIFVFVDAEREHTGRWIAGVLHVPGEKLRGGRLSNVNRAVIGHAHDRRALRVFCRSGDGYVYAGEFRIDPGEPFSFTESEGPGRAPDGIVFRLVPVATTSGEPAVRAPALSRALVVARRPGARARRRFPRVRLLAPAGRLRRRRRRRSSPPAARWTSFLHRAGLGTTLLLLGSCAAVAGTTWGWASAPVRPAVAMGFLLVCPGTALVRLLPARGTLTRLVIAVATSLTLETLLATVMVETGAWSSNAALAVLIAITAVGGVLGLRAPPEGLAPPRRAAATAGWTKR